jgi:DNA-binding GntR family transcriptional regulator
VICDAHVKPIVIPRLRHNHVHRPEGFETVTDALEGLPATPDVPLTLAESVAAQLRGLILDGTLPPGTPLRLAPLAQRLGVSVMPVRDALRLLEADRLVVVTPRRGSVVSPLSIEDAEEVYAVRVALESLCARHAAERLTDADVAMLEARFVDMEDAERRRDLRAFIEADHLYHSTLYRLAGRARLFAQIDDLTKRSSRYLPYLYQAWQQAWNPLEAHRPLLEAIRARDAALVGELTREHMEAAAGRLLEAIRDEGHEGRPTKARRSARWEPDPGDAKTAASP